MNRIAWRCSQTGETHRGEWIAGDLTEYVAELNRRWPGIVHWIETNAVEEIYPNTT